MRQFCIGVDTVSSNQPGTAALWQSASVDLAATTDSNRFEAAFPLLTMHSKQMELRPLKEASG